MALSPLRTGVAVGIIYGLWHLLWSALVAAGWAGRLLDLVLWMHFLKVPIAVEPFSFDRAALLFVLTSLVGCAVGALFAVVWNALHRGPLEPARPRADSVRPSRP